MAREPASPRRPGVEMSAGEARAAMAAPIGPEEERLLGAIRDAPHEDDAPRLVYGDWLLDRGDPRGELIITQCALDRMASDDPGRGVLERRVDELVARYREPWCGDIQALDSDGFVRGFFVEPRLPASALVQHADRSWRLSPFGRLQVKDFGDASAQLSACPALARYRALSCRESATDDDLVRLASSPHLAELESLDLEGCEIGDEGLIALARAEQLRELRSLELGALPKARRPSSAPPRKDLSLTGLRALAAAAFAPRLERLGLPHRELGEELVPVLAAFPALAELDLVLGGLRGSGAARLAASPLRLRSLGLCWNEIDTGGAYALASSPILDAVETLDVSSNPMGEAGALALVTSPRLRALRYFIYNCADGELSPAVVGALARSLPQLLRLMLRFSSLGPEAAAALAAGELRQLHRLELFGNKLGDAGAIAIARSTRLPALRVLDLSDNGLTDAGALALAESPHLSALSQLGLFCTPLGQRAIDALRARFGRGVVTDPPSP